MTKSLRPAWPILVLAIILAGLLAGCSSTEGPFVVPFFSNPGGSESPQPETGQPFASPPATPTAAPVTSITPFGLDEPLVAGATRVTGRGPAGLEITVVNVTLGAEALGSTRIASDGTFSLDVAPLPGGVRVGIMVFPDIPPQLAEHMDQLWGEGGLQLPSIGNVYASAMTKQQ